MNLFLRTPGKAHARKRPALLAAACLVVLSSPSALAQGEPAARMGQANSPAMLAQQTGPMLQSQQPAQQPPQQRQVQQPQQRQQPQRATPGPRIGEVAGRYAVLREEGKDTLCMVTLFETARGSGYYRAQLAPACRDNGIVIFDPIAWTIDRQGHISLQARKGHKMILERDANGVWQRLVDPKARPLALRRI
jgi:hypothetical protein